MATPSTRKNTKKQTQEISRMAAIVDRLKEIYPDAVCALEWGGQYGGDREELLRQSWKLMVMGRLSAQCTDARVNIVCKDLFDYFPTVDALADGDLSEIEAIVRPCGLYRTKASSIREASRILVQNYGGKLPDTMEELLALPGVGRKIANLLLGDVFGKGGVVTDTHCIRICGRLGMYPTTLSDPYRVEMLLADLIDPSEASDFCHRIVQFGRDFCRARGPRCEACPLAKQGLCHKRNKEVSRAK